MSRASLLRLVVLAGAILLLMTQLAGDRFATLANFQSMAFQSPELALISFAMMLAMLTGGIDLSVVSVANLAGVVGALTMTHWLPVEATVTQAIVASVAGVIAALITGVACGAVNGLLIGLVGVPPILATLGTMQLFMGAALVLTGGKAVIGLPDVLQVIGSGTAFGVPVPFLLLLVTAAVVATLASETVFGIEARLIGTNQIAAWFSAIPVRSVLVRTYVASAGIASVTGLLMVARANSAKADYGTSYLLQSILVVVLGGVSPSGGAGRVLGVGMAVITLQMLSSGFGMMRLTSFATQLAWGGFLLLVMVVNRFFERSGE